MLEPAVPAPGAWEVVRRGDTPRSDAVLLAALSRCPRGYISQVALARSCLVSPSTASRSMAILRRADLVVEREEVRALGRARRVRVIYANTAHPNWPHVQQFLDAVDTPPMPAPDPHAPLPAHLRHAFWNTDELIYAQLTPAKDGPYIAARALSTADPELIEYAAATVAAGAWMAAAQGRGLSPDRQALAFALAESASRKAGSPYPSG